MVQMNGTYQLVKNENFLEQLLAYKMPKEQAEKMDSLRPKIEVSINGDQITLKTDGEGEIITNVLTLNKEVDEHFSINLTVKSTATIKGDSLFVVSKHSKGIDGKREYKFTDAEVIMIIEADGLPTSKRFYKRV